MRKYIINSINNLLKIEIMKTIDLINSNEEVANKKSVKFSSKNNQDSKFKEKDKEKDKEKENKEKESTLNMRHLSKIVTSNYDPTDDSNWERFLKEFKSLHRNFESWEVIHGYFLTLTRFVEYLKNTYGSGYIEYLSALTLYSNYFFCKSNSLLMKKGDRGERFYFILKGKLQMDDASAEMAIQQAGAMHPPT